VAFVAFFPISAILIRIANFSGLLWVHAAMQLCGYAIFVAAAGLGIWIATSEDYITEPHAMIGMVLLGGIFFQPIGGCMHRVFFKKTGGRTFWSYGHIWIGRCAVLLGMINGGLGLQLTSFSTAEYAAHGACAGFIGVVYIMCALWGESRRHKAKGRFGGTSSGERSLNGDKSDAELRETNSRHGL
jgi:hypothetical protein